MNSIIEKINENWCPMGHLSEMQRDFYIDLFNNLKPKYCLEIGIAGGRHTATMLYSCEPTKAISVDINLDTAKGRTYVDKLKKNFNNFEFFEGDSTRLLNSIFFQTHFPNGVDYVLVDGGHSYNEALADMRNCFPYLNEGGKMIVDDFQSSGPIGCHIVEVDKAVKFFASENNLKYETIKLKDGKGMAVFTK